MLTGVAHCGTPVIFNGNLPCDKERECMDDVCGCFAPSVEERNRGGGARLGCRQRGKASPVRVGREIRRREWVERESRGGRKMEMIFVLKLIWVCEGGYVN